MAKPDKASIGFALIAKDAEKTLGPCLASFRDYAKQVVVCVDERTTDKTAQIARRYGAEVHPVKVSDFHECPAHGKVLAQDFAAARNASFTHLDPDLDYWAWVDADDVLEGAAQLPQLTSPKQMAAMDQRGFIGFWSPYHYAYVVKEDGTREVNTLFHRERIFRTKFHGQPQIWTWQHRVHEVCVPTNAGPWIQANDLIWWHQHQAHKVEQSAPRNQLLLEIELEEKPGDPRTVFYMGNGYFAIGDWYNAAEWYERYSELPCEKNPYELWQSYVYMSMAYERLGQLDASLKAAFGALETIPQHPEPYYRLAELYRLTGEYEKSLWWAQEGDGKPEAPFFVFKNPMDRSFNSKMPVADSLLQLGRLSEAKKVWQEAAASFPDERVLEKIKYCEQKEEALGLAQSYHSLATNPALTDDQRLEMYEPLPDVVKTFGRTRNIPMNILRRRRKALSQPRIVFWCQVGWEPWAPPSINGTGIGGSETAVIEIAKRFARAGWLVDVYNGADFMEGVHDGVGYWDLERLPQDEECDVLVVWRQPNGYDLPIKAKQRILWMHDLNGGAPMAEHIVRPEWDRVLGVSEWHVKMLKNYYPELDERKMGVVPNGVDLARFPAGVKKVPFRCVYASSPDRGLPKLLELWPSIVNSEPEAELHIAYGWETANQMIANGHSLAERLQAMKDSIEKRIENTKRVVWRGRLGQDELAKLYAESYLWTYPTDFLEVSCISAMEAMAGGAVPVTTSCGALPETIGQAGVLVPAPTFSRGYGETWVRVALGTMMEVSARKAYSLAGQERAKSLTWDASFQEWLKVLDVGPEVQSGQPQFAQNGGDFGLTADCHSIADIETGEVAECHDLGISKLHDEMVAA